LSPTGAPSSRVSVGCIVSAANRAGEVTSKAADKTVKDHLRGFDMVVSL
jgi:hypothetical protein